MGELPSQGQPSPFSLPRFQFFAPKPESVNVTDCSCAQLLSGVLLYCDPHGPARPSPLPMGFPSKNTGVGCHLLLWRVGLVACLLFSVPWGVVRGTPIPLPPSTLYTWTFFCTEVLQLNRGNLRPGRLWAWGDVTSLDWDWTGGHPVWTGPLASLLLYYVDLLHPSWPKVGVGVESVMRKMPLPLLLLNRFSQSCPTLCDPIDGSPSGSSVPGIIQARILEWVAISFSNACVHAKLLQLCLTLCDPMDSSPPGSSVHGILRQKYWSGLPLMGLFQLGSSHSVIFMETCIPFAQATATPGCHGISSQKTPPKSRAKAGRGPSQLPWELSNRLLDLPCPFLPWVGVVWEVRGRSQGRILRLSSAFPGELGCIT